MKEQIINYIKQHFYNVNNVEEESIIDLEKQIDDFHNNNPIDEELIIHESLALLIPPLADYLKSIELLNKIKTPKTVLLKVLIQYLNEGYVDDKKIEELKKSAENSDSIYNSMVDYLLALLVREKDKSEYEKLLIHSNNLNSLSVLSYLELGDLYMSIGEKEKGRSYIEKGLQYVKNVIKERDLINFCDYDSFVNEFAIGSYMTEINYNSWKSYLEKSTNKSRNNNRFIN